MNDATGALPPDLTLRIVTPHGSGGCALWWNGVAPYEGKRAGLIGRYEAQGIGARVLGGAIEALAAAGCEYAIGPMDGSTWHSYRLVTDSGTLPPFLFEPQTAPGTREDFAGAGFGPIATYVSALDEHLEVRDHRALQRREALAADGITLRSLDRSRFDEEVAAFYRISLVAFAANPFYRAIDEATFRALYAPYRDRIDTRFVAIAQDAGVPIAFLFAIPDALQAGRAGSTDTLIFKSAARLPDRRYAGMGRVLCETLRAKAHACGYRRVIHALQHEGNAVRSLTARFARPIRRYAVVGRAIGGAA